MTPLTQNEPAERGLIGAVFVDPSQAMLPSVEADDFADPRRVAIWRGIRSLGGAAFTASSLAAHIGDACTRPVRDEIREIEQSSYSSLGIADFATQIRGAALRRRLVAAANDIAANATNPTLEPVEALAKAQGAMLAASARSNRCEPKAFDAILVDTVAYLERARLVTDGLTGVTSGIGSLDTFTSGLHPGELWIVAARPGRGKTALAMLMAQAIATRHGPVAFASLEMPLSQLGLRAVARASQVPQSRLRRGTYLESDYERMSGAFEALHPLRLMAHDDGSMTLGDVRALALRTTAHFGGLSAVVVDYLQLMTADDTRTPREQQIASIARGLKMLSKELNVPVIALAQLSRKNESEKRRPQLSDLRESGAIEQDADTVLFLHSDDPEEGIDGWQDIDLIIGKQRNGPRTTLPLRFHGATMRFEEAPRDPA
jgi:replicative DNA helicase